MISQHYLLSSYVVSSCYFRFIAQCLQIVFKNSAVITNLWQVTLEIAFLLAVCVLNNLVYHRNEL